MFSAAVELTRKKKGEQRLKSDCSGRRGWMVERVDSGQALEILRDKY
jgi:hypothetical protein